MGKHILDAGNISNMKKDTNKNNKIKRIKIKLSYFIFVKRS